MNDVRTTTTIGNEGDDERHSLGGYVSDLLALEQHIAKPLAEQVGHEATSEYPRAEALLQELQGLNASHEQRLQRALDRLGGHAAAPIKSAWSSLLGGAAAAIGSTRKTKVTKWLRDDFTALNLAAMSYTLLHATAIGVGDAEIAELARTARGLRPRGDAYQSGGARNRA